MRQQFGHAARAVSLHLRQRFQQHLQSAVDVVQRHLPEPQGSRTRAAYDLGQQLEGEGRVGGNVGLQRGALDARAHAGHERDDVGRTLAAVQTHLADVFAGVVDAVGDLALAQLMHAERTQPAAEDDVEAVATLAFADKQRALGVAPHVAGAGQGTQ